MFSIFNQFTIYLSVGLMGRLVSQSGGTPRSAKPKLGTRKKVPGSKDVTLTTQLIYTNVASTIYPMHIKAWKRVLYIFQLTTASHHI